MTARASAALERAAALQALFDEVEAAPWAHDFFALLRRVEGLTPEAPRFGRALRPSQEALRLGQVPELDFAPAALASFTRGVAAPRLGVRFFGLLGPQGPMPLHLTEYARERRDRSDPTLARFLDLFHHRLLLLFYRAWAEAQPSVQHDRPGADRYAAWLGAVAGLSGTLRPQDTLPHGARLFHAGLLGGRGRHPEGLAKIVALHFGIPVCVEPHVAHWLAIERADRTRLGHARNRPERAAIAPSRLGCDAGAGSKLWDRQYKFRVVLGLLTLAQYESFLPDAPAWRALNDCVRQYAGPDLQWDVQLRLARDEVPAPHLGRRLRLGLTAWGGRAGRGLPAHDRADLRLQAGATLLRSGAR